MEACLDRPYENVEVKHVDTMTTCTAEMRTCSDPLIMFFVFLFLNLLNVGYMVVDTSAFAYGVHDLLFKLWISQSMSSIKQEKFRRHRNTGYRNNKLQQNLQVLDC